jgi:hypothetical protein
MNTAVAVDSEFDKRGRKAPEDTKTFIGACKDFFGVKEGQKPLEFGKEVQALDADDRVEIATGLAALGYVIAPFPTGV